MEENGKIMELKDSEREFLDYLWSIEALDNLLGIRTIDFYTGRDVLFPYISRIIRFIVDNIYRDLGNSGSIEEKITLVEQLFEHGADYICSERAKELGDEVLGDTEENYDQDRFVFCWSNVMSVILMRLRIQNPLKEERNSNCGCCCSRGDSWKTWDNYISGVYPEDENYEAEEQITSGEAFDTNTCGCSYRK